MTDLKAASKAKEENISIGQKRQAIILDVISNYLKYKKCDISYIENCISKTDLTKCENVKSYKPLKDLLKEYHIEVIRYAILEKHYSESIDLSGNSFSMAEKHLYYFYNTLLEIDSFASNFIGSFEGDIIDFIVLDDIKKKFMNSMDDDFDTEKAIKGIFLAFKYVNGLIRNKKYFGQDITETTAQIKEMLLVVLKVLGILQENPEIFVGEIKKKYLKALKIDEIYINEIISKRLEAKVENNYELADELMNVLLKKGIILIDTKEGTKWDIKELYDIVK